MVLSLLGIAALVIFYLIRIYFPMLSYENECKKCLLNNSIINDYIINCMELTDKNM